MTSTFGAASSRSSRRVTKAGSNLRFAALAFGVAVACSSQPRASTKVEEAPFFRLPVAVSPDSAVKLARYALGEVNGAIQQARVQRDVVIIATRYTRERKNGGHTEVTIFAAVDRKPARLDPIATMVELSAWAIDVQPTRTGLSAPGRNPRDLPTLTTTSPMTVSSSQEQPYRITRGDTLHWNKLEDVLNSLIDISTKNPRP